MPEDPINPNRLSQAPNCLHNQDVEEGVPEKQTSTVNGRQVSPLLSGKQCPTSNVEIPSSTLTARTVTHQPIGYPEELVAMNQQVIGHDCMAYSLALMGCQPFELQGDFHLIYQPEENLPLINLSTAAKEANLDLWCQYQQQADLIQQYNQQILYGLLNTIEQQKQQLLSMAVAYELPPSIPLVQMVMPSVVWPQPVYLPNLSNAIAPMPSSWQFPSNMLDRSNPPWALASPIIPTPKPQVFNDPGFYVVPQFAAQFNSITNPLYLPWINHMSPWIEQLSQGYSVDPAAFFEHSQQSLVTPEVLAASYKEENYSPHEALTKRPSNNGAKYQQISPFSEKLYIENNPLKFQGECNQKSEENKYEIKKEEPNKLKEELYKDAPYKEDLYEEEVHKKETHEELYKEEQHKEDPYKVEPHKEELDKEELYKVKKDKVKSYQDEQYKVKQDKTESYEDEPSKVKQGKTTSYEDEQSKVKQHKKELNKEEPSKENLHKKEPILQEVKEEKQHDIEREIAEKEESSKAEKEALKQKLVEEKIYYEQLIKKKGKVQTRPHTDKDQKHASTADSDATNNLTLLIPKINPAQWISVASDMKQVSTNNDNNLYSENNNKYYARPLPALPEKHSGAPTKSDVFLATPAFEINQDVSVEAVVDISTDFNVEHDIQEGFASAASNIDVEIDLIPDHLKVKSKRWVDFVEMNQKDIDKFKSQVKNADDRRANKLYDGFYSNWHQKLIRSGPPEEYDFLVSEKAAQKYHETFFPGTELKNYKKGQVCLLDNNTPAHDNMHFDDILKGFALIEDKVNKRVYLCYDENYCHKNSTTIPRKRSGSTRNTIPGLVPELSLKGHSPGKRHLVVEGESSHDFLNPPKTLPVEIKSLMKKYGTDVQSTFSEDSSWMVPPYPHKKLHNSEINLVSDISNKMPACKQKPKIDNLDFISQEAIMCNDSKMIIDLGNITAKLAIDVVKNGFPKSPDLISNIEKLLDKNRMQENFLWTSDENNGNDAYCNVLNQSSKTSGTALRYYQLSRRVMNGLIASLEYSSTEQSFKDYIQLLCSMEDVNTELNTEDYESFYADPKGNPNEGKIYFHPQDSIPVISDYQARGGLVVKPFNKYGQTRVSFFADEFPTSYLASALNKPVKNYGDHPHKVIAIEDPNAPNGWLPMSYEPHTHSLQPLKFFQFEELNLKGVFGKYADYIDKAKDIKSRALVADDKSSKKPSKVTTKTTHDVFGSNGLNVMCWPGMRYCSLNSDKDASQWNSTLAEEKSILHRYKQLTPLQRNMAFEITMASTNGKRNLSTNPNKIKGNLDLAIYLVEIAVNDAKGSDENAAKTLHQIRHLIHVDMPRQSESPTIEGSSQNHLYRMVAFIKAHKNPREGFHSLKRKLQNDQTGMFLKTANLDEETQKMQEQGNTFINESMQYKKRAHPFYLEAHEEEISMHGFDECKNIDLKNAISILSRTIINPDYKSSKTLEDFKESVKMGVPFEYYFSGSFSDNRLAEWINKFYLNNNKVEQITGSDRTKEKLDVNSIFQLDSKVMNQNSEKLLLDDCKNDCNIMLELSKNQYSKPDALEQQLPHISGAIAIPFHNTTTHGKYDPISIITIEAAKAISERVLSTAIVRPDSHVCTEGIEKLTATDNFYRQPTETSLKTIQYTTAALLQEDCKVNNLRDFSMWEMLEFGSSAHPKKLENLEHKRDELFSKKKACIEMSNVVEDFEDNHKELVDVMYDNDSEKSEEENNKIRMNNLTEIGKQEDVKNFITYMNGCFEGLGLTIYNLHNKLYETYDDKPLDNIGDIKWQGYILYPDANDKINPGKKVNYGPTTDEGKERGVKVLRPDHIKCIRRCDPLKFRLERLAVELNKTSMKYEPEKPHLFPAKQLKRLFISELEELREQGVFLPLQDLQAAIINITCNNEHVCINLAQENKEKELKDLVVNSIQNQVKMREEKKQSSEQLNNKFEKSFSEQEITKCFNTLQPIREKEECQKLSKIISDNPNTEESRKAAQSLNRIKEDNGIKCHPDTLKLQVKKLKEYTLQAIKNGPDAIAKNYHELLQASNGSIDDQLKALGMTYAVFSINKKPPEFPKSEQTAAILAVINSDSTSVAIAAEPGSGKSVCITPLVILTQKLKQKNQNFPLFVTNNEILLQQDVENFREWGKAFNIPILKLDNNYESNLRKYAEPSALIFGTTETVMGDKLRLDSMDMAERIGKDKGKHKALGQCPNDKVIKLQENGFNRAVIIDEYDTVKDRDSTGALIISKSSENPADNCGELSYDAYFTVINSMQDLGDYREFKQKVINYLTKEVKEKPSAKAKAELAKANLMTDKDWQKRKEGIMDFVMYRANKYQLNKTYTIGYEVAEDGSASKKTIMAISDPTQEHIKKIKKMGFNVKIYPINQTTSEIVRNASFSNDASNYLAYFHGLPLVSSAVTVSSASSHNFFEKNFSDNGIYTLTATYGSGEMRDELVPKGRTNICFKTPYKLNLTEYPAQIFSDKLDMYDNAVNLAYSYIDQGKDVILLSSQLEDTFALDAALNHYQNKKPSVREKMEIVTLANLQKKPDHEVFTTQVHDLNKPFGFEHTRKKGYIINSTDASARGFNYGANDAVIISIDCPPGERADLQKKRRVARNGRPGIAHNLMTTKALPDYNVDMEHIDPMTGIYGKESQGKLRDHLANKDSYIAKRASIRRKLHEVTSSCEQVFQLYYQQLMILQSCKNGRIPQSEKLSAELGETIKQLNENHPVEAMKAWLEWRDNFLLTGINNAKTPEDADQYIREQMIDNKSFDYLKNKLPFYLDISNADCTEKIEVEQGFGHQCRSFEEEDKETLIETTKILENCLYKRKCKADEDLKKMYMKISDAA